MDGQDALEILGREAFDVVFTDLEMPRMHGYELIQAIVALRPPCATCRSSW